jgi:hypothetical protein
MAKDCVALGKLPGFYPDLQRLERGRAQTTQNNRYDSGIPRPVFKPRIPA